MDTKTFFTGRAIGFIVLLVIVGIVAGFYALNNYIYKEKQDGGVVVESYRATLTGVQVCLSHKDTSGPQTMECAIGIETDTGEYYALDLNLMSQVMTEISQGERFTATGVVTPIEYLSTDHWQKYNVQGIFSVTDSVSMHSTTQAPVFVWKFEEADSLNLDGFPETDIIIEATYSGGKVETKLIDTTPGGCNTLPDSRDDISGAETIQCYSAGLGYHFRITKGDNSYKVERKTFEEALPNYEPPVYEYEVVAEFPLF
ncbi:MAG: hypothetical protein K9M36_03380 [Candidatus Pacebacteria bacterium]|nr:hypothetical protein [Candidatus Paceibacterota bacterium]